MAGFSVSLHAAAHIPVSGNLNLQSRRPLGVRQETESRREIPRYRETCLSLRSAIAPTVTLFRLSRNPGFQ
jgi:hypothetical protein